MYFGTINLTGSFPIGNLPRVIHYLSKYYGIDLRVLDIRNEDADVEVEIGAENYFSRDFYVFNNKTINTNVFHEKREDGKGYIFKITENPETIIEMKDDDGFHFE